MDIAQLLNLSKITRNADAEDSQPRATGKRPINKFTTEAVVWLLANSTTHTATEAGEHLGHTTGAIRKKCLALGLQLKYSAIRANHTKPGTQKGLRVAETA